VKITSLRTGKSVIVQVVDICTCYGVRRDPNDDRLIDLSPQTWEVLGVPLALGVTPITLEVLP
jgi:rare lipoprotein A (peptidoglycan hydrolase)